MIQYLRIVIRELVLCTTSRRKWKKILLTYNEIPASNLKAIEVFAGVLGLEYVFIHHVRSAARSIRISQSYLANSAVLAENIVHIFFRNLIRQTPAKQTSQQMSFPATARRITYLTKRIRFTSGGSRIPTRRGAKVVFPGAAISKMEYSVSGQDGYGRSTKQNQGSTAVSVIYNFIPSRLVSSWRATLSKN